MVRRVQAKSAHNKRRRSVAKGWLSEEEAQVRIPDAQQKAMSLPYAEMHSLSTQSRMRLYIEHGPLLDKPVAGMFNAYGLSTTATIPGSDPLFQGVANSLIFQCLLRPDKNRVQ